MGARPPPESVEHLADALRKLPIKLERAILFGSRARGDFWEHSDWDVVLVSEDFQGLSFSERMIFVIRHITVSGVEAFCYTPEQFEKGRDTFTVIGEAWREGVDLIPAGSEQD